ncbi:hypothetical protein [Amycolatopsis thermophila]|uniref:Gas vesicle protein n=1 Tax=Amycolatopsis thermophila TaxID=206084 RepID=A0ABU0ETN4_9PSEU|nr:hypothetical protein [Amycolatopsis thermophila]MDQ0378265.1 gas vesicle protein [Amycolatopsis thermophila]
MGDNDYKAGRVVAGAAVGAAVGSVVPGVGTAIGAGVGAVVGGLAGLMSTPDAEHHEANIGGRTIDARKIWEQIHPGDASSLTAGANAAKTLKGVHEDRAKLIQQINDMMDNAWKGMASGQVQAGAHPLGIWLQDSATNLGKSETYLNDQASAFHTVHSKVEEIPAQAPDGGFLDGLNPFSDTDEQIEQYNQRGKANVDAFNNYYQASMTNAGGMPQYNAWQGNVFSNGNPGGGFPGGGGGAGGVPGGGGAGAFKPAGTGDLPQFSSTTPSANLPHTATNAAYPPNTGVGYNPAFDSTSASGYTPPSTSGFGPGGGGGGFGPGGGGGGGGLGSGAGGVGAAGFGGMSAGVGSGATAGTGAGGAGAGGAGARGASTRAGRAGAAGTPGMGGRGGHANGEDDELHENKYMVGDDPNELFGTDELTAPPVIGE